MGTLRVTTIKGTGDGSLIMPNGLDVQSGVATFAGAIDANSTANFAGAVTLADAVSITDNTASTSTTTGALKVTGGVGIAKSLFVGEGVSVAGTITYNDVTNVDSVGIVTARSGFKAGAPTGTAATVYSTGDAHFVGIVTSQKSFAAPLVTVGTGASVHSPATNTLILGTNNLEHVRLTSAGGITLNNGSLIERANRNTSAAINSAPTLDLDDGMTHWFTTAIGAANVKVNIVSSAGINTEMATGDLITVTVMTNTSSTSNFIQQLRVDGKEASACVTTYWVGGSAPTAGSGSGVDTYCFSLIKTGSGTFDMVANQAKGS